MRLQHSRFALDLDSPLDYMPQGKGFIAATSMKLAGQVTVDGDHLVLQ